MISGGWTEQGFCRDLDPWWFELRVVPVVWPFLIFVPLRDHVRTGLSTAYNYWVLLINGILVVWFIVLRPDRLINYNAKNSHTLILLIFGTQRRMISRHQPAETAKNV